MNATHDFDVVLFCHTFGVQNDREIEITRRQVVQIVQNHLKPSGVALFLTPHKPPEKIKLMDAIREGLVKAGMRHHLIDDISSDTRWMPTKAQARSQMDRQHLIIEARHRINKIAIEQLGVAPPFSETDPRNDLPYYRFSGRIDIFNKGTVTSA